MAITSDLCKNPTCGPDGCKIAKPAAKDQQADDAMVQTQDNDSAREKQVGDILAEASGTATTTPVRAPIFPRYAPFAMTAPGGIGLLLQFCQIISSLQYFV